MGQNRPTFRILYAKKVHRLEKITPPSPVSKKTEFFKIKMFIRFLEKGEMVAGKVWFRKEIAKEAARGGLFSG